MRSLALVMGSALLALLAVPSAASPETREEYLARLRDVCAPGCQPSRDLLRAQRKRNRSGGEDIAAVLMIREVSRFEDTYRLHTQTNALNGTSFLWWYDFRMPQLNGRPFAFIPDDIVIEIDQQTLVNLLNLSAEADPGSGQRRTFDEGGNIIVEGQRNRERTLPRLHDLRKLVRNRAIAVRGEPRLDPALVGARLDRRQKQLTIMVDNVDDLVLLPRYDKDGEPILDGPLAGLRELSPTPAGYRRKTDGGARGC